MKLGRLLIALSILALPVVIRALWFYQGVYQPSKINTPDYASLEMPLPDLSTPLPQNTAENMSNSAPKPLVLIDAIHNNIFSLSEIDVLTQGLTNNGIEVKVTSYDSLDDQLKKASAFVIIAPTMPFDSWEIHTITRFVERGGHLLVITDPTRNFNYSDFGYSDSASQPPTSLSVDIANQLLEPFGVAFTNDYLYNLVENEGNFRNIILENFNKGKLTNGLSRVVFYSTHSIKTNQTNLIQADNKTLSSLTDQAGDLIVAASASGDRVMAIGDLTFMTHPYNQVADNGKLIDNISTFLTKNEKTHDLYDYPYIFSRPVTLLRGKEIKLDKTFLDSLNSFKTYLIGPKLSLTLDKTKIDGQDLLILDTYPPSSELKSYIGEFGLEFNVETVEELESLKGEDEEETPQPSPTPTLTPEEENDGTEKDVVNSILVPGFGLLNTSEVGIILFKANSDQNSLTLLADTVEHVNTLSGMVASDISSCNILEGIAVCTFDGTDYNTDYNTDTYDNTYYSEDEMSPVDETVTPFPDTTGTPFGPVGGVFWLVETPTPAR